MTALTDNRERPRAVRVHLCGYRVDLYECLVCLVQSTSEEAGGEKTLP